jgi:hypothetical protein
MSLTDVALLSLMLDACRHALTYLDQSPTREGAAWRELRAELRRAILAAGGTVLDARESGDEAWMRKR